RPRMAMRLDIWKNSMRSRRMETLQARSIRITPIALRCRKSTAGKVAFGASSKWESDPQWSITARSGTVTSVRFTSRKPDACRCHHRAQGNDHQPARHLVRRAAPEEAPDV